VQSCTGMIDSSCFPVAIIPPGPGNELEFCRGCAELFSTPTRTTRMAVADFSLATVPVPSLSQRLRPTLGPPLAGLPGGGVVRRMGLMGVVVLLRNCAATYDKFPSLARPWLARDLGLPEWLILPLSLLGCVLPFAMGLATVWLVRPRDFWADLSAGITT